MSTTIASRAPVAGNAVRGIIQLLLALAFAVAMAAGAWGFFTSPANHPDRWGGLLVFGSTLPFFLMTFPYAGRNLHRLLLDASVVADEEKIVLRVPMVPFRLAPYLVVREAVVSWPEADLSFTPGKQSKLLVSSARPETTIESGYFGESLYEIDAGLRQAVEDLQLGRAVIPPAHVFTSSSQAVLLIAGAVIVVVSGAAMIPLLGTGLENLLAMPWIAGMALIAMGVLPRQRVILDPRGLFVERGLHLDYVTNQAFSESRAEFSSFGYGVFQSGHFDINIEGKRMRIGFNRVFGFGIAVDEIRRTLTAA